MTITGPKAAHADILETTFGAHGVRVTFQHAYKGPSVTLYAYQLEPGQSVKSVTAIATDLAVAVGRESVRILTPIPDTSLIGVEVPNQIRCTVDYEPETSDWSGPGLSIPIGVDVKNHVIEADLTKLPHLLIAGSTGSGKSVALNTIITALIDRNSPADLRLHLIDPKRVELAQFADAPQVENVVTNLDDAADLLVDIVDLMDARYELFEEHGVRNIFEYNALVDGIGVCKDMRTGHSARFLPYHVVVVDEMADLIMQRKKEIEPLIVRIAQLSRAAGIHLILATQRPTVDVITGLIKANVPSRLAFTVASVKDSMVILDQTGANALAGKGDALFLPVGQNRPTRVQGLWTSDDRLNVVVSKAIAKYEKPVQEASGSQAHDDEGDVPDSMHGWIGEDRVDIARTLSMTNAYDPPPEPAHPFANITGDTLAAMEAEINARYAQFPKPSQRLNDWIKAIDAAAVDLAAAYERPVNAAVEVMAASLALNSAAIDLADAHERPVNTEQRTDWRGALFAGVCLGIGAGIGIALVLFLIGIVS